MIGSQVESLCIRSKLRFVLANGLIVGYTSYHTLTQFVPVPVCDAAMMVAMQNSPNTTFTKITLGF